MLISIIIPVYKVEKYLKRCVDSVIGQTYPNLQIILVDDGSPDNCPQICDEYAAQDKRIEVIHQANAGVSNARNNGLKVAKGDYILFIDSDDYIAPDMCEKMLAFAQQTQADIVVCDIQYVNAVQKKKTADIAYSSKPYISVKNALMYLVSNSSFGYSCVWNKLIRHELLENEHFREDIKRGEDLIMLSSILLKTTKIAYISEKFYYYFQNPKGVTLSRELNSRVDAYKALQYYISTCQKQTNQSVINTIDRYYFDAAVIAAFLILLCDKQNQYVSVFNEILTYGKVHKKDIIRSGLPLVKKILFLNILLFPNMMRYVLRSSIINPLIKRILRVSD